MAINFAIYFNGHLYVQPFKGNEQMSALGKTEWTSIHKKAWGDPKFRYLLETDPTGAIKLWANEQSPPWHVDKIVDLSSWIKVAEDDWPGGAPSCC